MLVLITTFQLDDKKEKFVQKIATSKKYLLNKFFSGDNFCKRLETRVGGVGGGGGGRDPVFVVVVVDVRDVFGNSVAVHFDFIF